MPTRKVDRVARLLGLECPYEFTANRAGERQMGRTTTMLLHALVDVLEGKSVKIAARNPHHAQDLVKQVRDWVAKLNANLCGSVSVSRHPKSDTSCDVLYIDHHRG